ncbi:MAG TPA: hypothetical protein VFM51_06740 [Solirubrobacterales bacterium]|nr:hypothetical protein [Solirubrobacterales bacterium]
MKYLKMLGLAAVSTMALMAFVGASTASATTLEISGVTTNSSVTIKASLQSGFATFLKSTSGGVQNACLESQLHGNTSSPYTASHIGGPLTEHGGSSPTAGLSFNSCTRSVTVDDPGTLTIEHITGTTKGTVYSQDTTVRWEAPFLGYILCRTHEKEHIGTLTGIAAGTATLHINTVLDCGALPSAKWEAIYTVTSPEGLGVSA